MRRFRASLWAALRRNRFESEMEEEMEDHLRARIDGLVAAGMDCVAAERQARREFGFVAALKDECRDSQGLGWIDSMTRDLHFAFRILRKSPGFTCTAIVILALCIGANTAIFSVVDAALFRELPFREPQRLALVVRHIHSPQGEGDGNAVDGKTWEYLHDNSRLLDLALTGSRQGVNLALSDTQAVYVQQFRVSAGYFRVLGAAPLLGREFDAAEDRAGGPAVALLSEALWRRVFAADPQIVGRTIRLRGEPHTVIGIMPAESAALSLAELWTPLRPSTKGEGGGANYQLFARLRPGASMDQANAELSGLSVSFFAERHLPPGVAIRFGLVRIKEAQAEGILRPVFLLWAAVGVVLLIGCVNIAGLTLARGETRRHEIATRMALGSSRMAITRQLLTESLLIAAGGGIAGFGLGAVVIAALSARLVRSIHLLQAPQLDARVVLLTMACALATTLLFGVYPAWSLTRVDVRSGLAKSSRTASSHHSFARNLLVAGQIALGVMLLAAAGLVLRTFSYLMHLDPGFDGRNVLTASLSLEDARYTGPEAVNRLFDATLEKVRAIPGVEAAGVALTLPYERALNDQMGIKDGPRASEHTFTSNLVYVTPGLFEALRLRLVAGRYFTAGDRAGGQQVAVVNEAFARRYFKGDEALGRHLNDGEIVGIVADTQQVAHWEQFGPVDRVPTVYIPAAQFPAPLLTMVHSWFSPKWVVRSRAAQSNLPEMTQQAVASIDPLLPFEEFRSMDDLRFEALELQSIESVLFASLAGLALLLTAVGIFGMIAQAVSERTREFGIRMALGAPASSVITRTVRRGFLLAVAGSAVGCLLALASGKFLRSLLWGVQANDPLVFAAVACVLLFVAILASLLPSLRIARINPAETLRAE